MAAWSSDITRAQGARGPGLNSRSSPWPPQLSPADSAGGSLSAVGLSTRAPSAGKETVNGEVLAGHTRIWLLGRVA